MVEADAGVLRVCGVRASVVVAFRRDALRGVRAGGDGGCGRLARYIVEDVEEEGEEPYVVAYCLACSEREFGASGRDTSNRA